MQREKITIGSFVHVYNRGNRGQEIVKQSKDCWHFLEMLYYFNTSYSSGRPFRDLQKIELERSNLSKQGHNPFVWPNTWPSREPIVKIMAFSLLPNHYHLFLKQIKKGGISMFMKKIGNGMTGYFNLKYNETGRLFQGSYKSKIIDEEIYLEYLSTYIQVKNVFELYPGGYSKAVREFDKAYQWAVRYPYCSLADYSGERNSPIIDKDILGELFDKPQEHKEFTRQCLEEVDLDNELKTAKLE